MKKYLVIGLLGISLGLTPLLLAIRPWQDRPGITKANFDRVEDGMTVANVEAIFGESASAFGWVCHSGSRISKFAEWQGRDGAIAGVVFVKDVVTMKAWTASTESFAGKIRRWLKGPAR